MKLSKKYNVTISDLINYILRPIDNKEQEKARKKKESISLISAAIGGFVSGIAAALLLSPASGEKNLKELNKSLKDTNKKVSKFSDKKTKELKKLVNH